MCTVWASSYKIWKCTVIHNEEKQVSGCLGKKGTGEVDYWEAQGKFWGCWMYVSIVLIDLMVSRVFMSVKGLELYTLNMYSLL